MRIIFCDSVYDRKIVDPDYLNEFNSAIKYGFNVSLISHEELVNNNIDSSISYVKSSSNLENAIYRGWMITPEQYEQLYNQLLTKNIRLINSPDDFKFCHYLPLNYPKIEEFTPKSFWTKDLSEDSILSLAKKFGDSPVIIKDYVKSEKHYWNEACFIPNASDFEQTINVVTKFFELRGNHLNEGIVIREFVELEFLTNHSKSGMPLTKELRIFFFKNEILKIGNYWDEGNYNDTSFNIDSFKAIGKKISSDFFTMDIAKKKNGNWIIIEIGDAQVSGLPENIDTNSFYSDLVNKLL